jgi:hypothetical protein
VGNPEEAARCTACGKPLPRRPRRRGPAEEGDDPPSPEAARRNAAARRAYRLCLLGLVPGLGLVLGPVSVVLGAVARARGKDTPGFTEGPPAAAAVLFGALISATQWAGVTLMVLGRSARP